MCKTFKNGIIEHGSKYQAVALNAVKHGILSKLVVLPYEDEDEFSELLAALVEDHQPVGITEQLLVEELACIIWRKRRVLMAEGAIINERLADSQSDPMRYLQPDPMEAIAEYTGLRIQPSTKASQTLGEAVQPHKMEQLNRYETHLDRKFERNLAMLLKLRELRGG